MNMANASKNSEGSIFLLFIRKQTRQNRGLYPFVIFFYDPGHSFQGSFYSIFV